MTRLIASIVLALIAAPAWADESTPTFDVDVKPILRKHCLACHNGERPRGELDLSSYENLLTGGLSGKAVVAKKPEESPLYTMTAHLEDPKMPPNKPKIPQRELDTIRKWIDGGLVEKSGAAVATITPAPSVAGLGAATPLARATPVTALAASPVAPLVAVSGKKQVLVYELPAGKLLGAVPFPEGEVHALRFSRDGAILIAGGGVGGQSGTVVGFEVGTWKRLFAVGDETDAVLAADISADKTRVVFGGPGRAVKVVSVPDGKQLHTFRKPTDWVLSVGFSPEGLLVAGGDRFGGLYVWETKSGKEFLTLRGHTKGVTGLAWRADSDALASSSEDGTVRVWDMHSGNEAAKWTAHADGALDIAFHSTGVIATAGRDSRVKMWDAKGKSLADIGPASDVVLKNAISADAKTVVTGDWSGEVRVWPAAGGPGAKLALPIESKPIAAVVVPVAAPALIPVSTPVAPARPAASVVNSFDLTRKRAALKAIEDAAEKLKDEAARNPKNQALAKAYLQLCEAALAMKAEVLEAESATGKQPEGDK
jgi:WD40 repeat protein